MILIEILHSSVGILVILLPDNHASANISSVSAIIHKPSSVIVVNVALALAIKPSLVTQPLALPDTRLSAIRTPQLAKP